MGLKCMVNGCHTRGNNKLPHVKLHRFPTRSDLLETWLQFCGLLDKRDNIRQHWKICSEHFSDADYVNRETGALKFDAIPVKPSHTKIYDISIRQNVQSGNIRILLPDSAVLNLQLNRVPSMQKGSIKCTVNNLDSTTARIEAKQVPAAVHQFLSSQHEALKRKNKLLTSQLQACRSSMARLSTSKFLEKSTANASELKLKVKHGEELEKMNAKLIKVQNSQTKLEAGVSKIFSVKQITMLVENKKKMYWTDDDIAKSITLRYKANPYEHLRLNGFPFPCTRTLQRAMKDIDFSPGILQPIMNLLKHYFIDAPISSKLCVLSFDELSIDSSIAYDPTSDQILGPKTNMNTYFLRGLIAQWKQPIAFYFDDPFTVQNFMSILKAVGDIGLSVVGLVTDLGGKNRGLLNRLQVNVRKNKEDYIIQHQIQNPTFHEINIQVFADLPHLLKLLRNNMLKHGLKIKGEYWIRKQDYEHLIEVDKEDFQSAWKLNKSHLDVAGKKKQKVLPAFQTFSRTVAELWRKVFVNRQKEADFIQLVNDYCDLLNTRCLTGTTAAKKAFGLDERAQMKILQDMEESIIHLRVGEVKYLYPFQRGFLMSIHSLKALLKKVSALPYSQKFILTHRLNQDIAENCFSMIRKVGAYNQNPDPVDAKNRLKLVCLGWDDTHLTTCPVQSENQGGFLTGDMIRVLREHSVAAVESDEQPNVILDPERPEANQLTSENFEEVMANLNIQQRCENDGQEYIAGFAVSKHVEEYPELVASEEELDLIRDTSWVLKLSDGRLAVPSLLWRNQSEQLYQEFRSFHRGYKYGINTKKGVLKGFISALKQKYPEIPPEPLTKFIKTIFFARIKTANRRIKEERSEKLRAAIAHKYLKDQVVIEEEDYEEEDYDELNEWDGDLEAGESNRHNVVENLIMQSYQSYIMELDENM